MSNPVRAVEERRLCANPLGTSQAWGTTDENGKGTEGESEKQDDANEEDASLWAVLLLRQTAENVLGMLFAATSRRWA